MTNWGNVYEVEFESPVTVPGMVNMTTPMQPIKVAALNITDAISKVQAQGISYPISGAKLILSGVQW